MATGPVLSSKWGSLSAALLASIYPVDFRGYRIDGPEVQAPPSEATIELTANWQSPFENSGAHAKLPGLLDLLQTGAAGSAVEETFGKGAGGGIAADVKEWTRKSLDEGVGRTSLTKLNSQQAYTGTAPVKFPVTLHFRAYSDPESEVHAPIDQLSRWVLPKSLALNGAILSAVINLRDGLGAIKALMPSEAPQLVGLKLGRYTFAPLVIESLSYPMTGPRGRKGELLAVPVTLMLASLTALDAEDWGRARMNQPARLFSNQA